MPRDYASKARLLAVVRSILDQDKHNSFASTPNSVRLFTAIVSCLEMPYRLTSSALLLFRTVSLLHNPFNSFVVRDERHAQSLLLCSIRTAQSEVSGVLFVPICTVFSRPV